MTTSWKASSACDEVQPDLRDLLHGLDHNHGGGGASPQFWYATHPPLSNQPVP